MQDAAAQQENDGGHGRPQDAGRRSTDGGGKGVKVRIKIKIIARNNG